jgi:hypothetical protein
MRENKGRHEDYKPLGLGLDNLEQVMSIHKVNELVGGNIDRVIRAMILPYLINTKQSKLVKTASSRL